MTIDMRQFGARYAEAWCGQDPARVAGFFAPDGSLTVNDGAPAVGRNAIADVTRSFMTSFPDLRVVMDDLIAKDGRTEFHWTLTGTYKETGKRVRISGFENWTIGADGLIASSKGHFDAGEYNRQLQHGAH